MFESGENAESFTRFDFSSSKSAFLEDDTQFLLKRGEFLFVRLESGIRAVHPKTTVLIQPPRGRAAGCEGHLTADECTGLEERVDSYMGETSRRCGLVIRLGGLIIRLFLLLGLGCGDQFDLQILQKETRFEKRHPNSPLAPEGFLNVLKSVTSLRPGLDRGDLVRGK